jgi:small GTP-binding protein
VNQELRILLEALPHDCRPHVEKLWNQLPPDVRRESELTLGSFIKLAKKDPASVMDMLRLLQRSAAPVMEKASQVAVVGPVNVGKSTLYNALVDREQDKAKCSPIPGTTKVAQSAQVGLFELVDTPGLDHGDQAGEEERNLAFDAASEAAFLLIVFDAAGSVTQSDRQLYLRLQELGKPHLVVLNKIDLIPKHLRDQVRASAARILNLSQEAILPVSATQSSGLDQLILEITAAEPKLLVRVAESLPGLRRKLSWQAIRRAAMLSALVGLSPLPLTDLVPLTLLQGNLILTLSQIYAHPMSWRSILELGSSFGAGWLARLLFQEVSKFAGAPGWVLSASIAASATFTLGVTALTWFETGKKPDPKEVEAQAQGLFSRIRESLSRLGRKRPSKKRITQELENLFPDQEPPVP